MSFSKKGIPAYLPQLSKPAEHAMSFTYPFYWWTQDPQRFANAIKPCLEQAAPGVHFADNLFTWGRNLSMLDDQAFMSAWEGNAESAVDKGIMWRRYVLACAGYHCVQLDGDFVECGAYTGVGVKTVIDYLGGAEKFSKRFWAYDLFEHHEGMANHSMPEHSAELESTVRHKFKTYPQVEVVKGLIPDVLREFCPERIAYLHVDLNQPAAEVGALEVLFDRVVPGGMVILDDYEWAGLYRPQKLAEDEWFELRHYRVLPLPTGQGLIFKR